VNLCTRGTSEVGDGEWGVGDAGVSGEEKEGSSDFGTGEENLTAGD